MSGESVRSDPSGRLERLAAIVDQLACPACFSTLRLNAPRLVCQGCGRVYPIDDGIPVLIAEQSSSRTESDSDRNEPTV